MVGSETYPPSLERNWQLVERHPYIIGDFQWTAWDYLGEAGVGVPLYGKKRGGFNRPYPCISAGCGAIDMTGEPGTPAKFSAIVWKQEKKPYIAVRPVNHSGENYFLGQWRATDAIASWSFPGMTGRKAEIEVYGIGSEVELWQDGKSLGRKKLQGCLAKYETIYRPGKLEAVNYDTDGKAIDDCYLQSAGEETVLTILPEKTKVIANGEDLLYVAVEVTDSNGIRKMLSEKRIHVEVDGAGSLAGIGSANPYTTDSFLGNEYDTYQGRMLFIVRSRQEAGKIRILISAVNGR